MTRNVTDVQLILSFFFLVERLMEYSVFKVFNALKLDETCGGYVCLSICLYIYIDIGISEAFIENFCLLGKKNVAFLFNSLL